MQRAALYISKSLVVLLVLLALATMTAAGYAQLQGLALLSVQTGSMRPAISPGDAVLVSQRPAQIVAGDIISFRSHDNPRVTITHRVASIDGAGRWLTRGDATSQGDRPVYSSQLVGKVERIIPLLGYSFDFVRHPAGLILSVHIPAVIMAASEIRRLSRYYEARRYRLYHQLRI